MQESFAICIELLRAFRNDIHKLVDELEERHKRERVRLYDLKQNFREKCDQVGFPV